jgi:hypothetical protein
MKKKLFLVLILLFIVFVSNSIAQEGSTVEKKIYIIGDASVLSGLNIYEKDTGKLICHAEVSDDGNFSCTLNADSILSEEEIFKIVAEVIVKILKDINIQAEPVWTKVE